MIVKFSQICYTIIAVDVNKGFTFFSKVMLEREALVIVKFSQICYTIIAVDVNKGFTFFSKVMLEREALRIADTSRTF